MSRWVYTTVYGCISKAEGSVGSEPLWKKIGHKTLWE